MSFKRTDLVKELQASLHDSVTVFQNEEKDGAFNRFLDLALPDLSRFRPYRVKQSITLIADQPDYAAPAGMIAFIAPLYGEKERQDRKPWDVNYPKTPTVKVLGGVNGAKTLLLVPAPTAAMITDLGSTFEFRCSVQHVIDDAANNTTIQQEDKALLILRAQAEAMKEMAMRNIKKPVQLNDGLNSITRNGTPAALYDQLMKAFERAAA